MSDTSTVKFPVITLCGSTRFKEQFEKINQELTLKGNVVISVGVFVHDSNVSISESEKAKLDKIHFQKIDMSDELFIINVDGYIGSSTKREIEYAHSQSKVVRYLVDKV